MFLKYKRRRKRKGECTLSGFTTLKYQPTTNCPLLRLMYCLSTLSAWMWSDVKKLSFVSICHSALTLLDAALKVKRSNDRSRVMINGGQQLAADTN